MVLQMGLEALASVANAFIQPIFVQILALALQGLPLTLTFFAQTDRLQDEHQFRNLPPTSDTFDFIVVGAGTGGSVVANRLSQRYRVLLLEAGGDPNPVQFIPTFAQFLWRYPEVDYAYKSVPQKYASQNANNRQTGLSAGRNLGGSSNLNIMIHLRGHAKDYDSWAHQTGYPDWSWDSVLPFFKSYENYEIPGDDFYHGYNGELRIEAPDYIGTAPEFVQAAMEFGYPNRDLNSAPYSEAFDVIRYPIRSGMRQATYKAFIEPMLTRLTLTVMRYSQVNKILMKPGNIAYGVEYDRHGETRLAFATKEVILAAGAIGSPKLLMLSGIGPREHLEELGIPVKVDLPVGQNLKDHLSVLVGPFYLDQPRSINLDRDVTPKEFIRWATTGTGRLTTTAAEATGAIPSSLARLRGEGNWPDLQFLLSCVSLTSSAIPFVAHALNFNLDVARQYYGPGAGRDTCQVLTVGSRPLSTGYMKLGGNSPYDVPIIDPNYLSDANSTDLRVLLEGVKIAVALIENSTAFGQALGARFTNLSLPGCEQHEFRSDAYFECFIMGWSLSTHHMSGTAGLGRVVDSQLKVLGTKQLRLVDNSVAPEQVSTNTQASVLMIAEKAASMILREWGHLDLMSWRVIRNEQDAELGRYLNEQEEQAEQADKTPAVYVETDEDAEVAVLPPFASEIDKNETEEVNYIPHVYDGNHLEDEVVVLPPPVLETEKNETNFGPFESPEIRYENVEDEINNNFIKEKEVEQISPGQDEITHQLDSSSDGHFLNITDDIKLEPEVTQVDPNLQPSVASYARQNLLSEVEKDSLPSTGDPVYVRNKKGRRRKKRPYRATANNLAANTPSKNLDPVRLILLSRNTYPVWAYSYQYNR